MTKAELGKEISEEYLREQTVKTFKKYGVTLSKLARRISEGLNATETKANYDKDRGKWVYSEEMIAFGARAKYVEIAIAILDLKPAEKHQVEHSIDGELSDVVKEIIKGVADYDQGWGA